jgi:hypothetical protein
MVEAEFGVGVNDPRLVWSIGNLALAESSINQSLGNTPFSHKRTVYPQSQFLLTRAISELPNIGRTAIDRAVDLLKPFLVWNAATVKERSAMLTRLAQNVWDISAAEETASQSGPQEASRTSSVPGQSEAARQADAGAALERILEIQVTTIPSGIVTSLMRHHAETKSTDHFSFSGLRAAIACLYARPEGATQAEANRAAEELGSPQKGYFNMLRQAKNWGHDVVVWDDQARGRVYKLIYNPRHSGPGDIDPPTTWTEMNVPRVPPSVQPIPWGE